MLVWLRRMGFRFEADEDERGFCDIFWHHAEMRNAKSTI